MTARPTAPGDGFGATVRQARIRAGLSQAALGAPTYTRSYISLVETGTRAPSQEVVEHIAAKLGIEVSQVRSWALASGEYGDAQAAVLQAEALTRLVLTSVPGATRAVEDLEAFALEANRLDLWWTAAHMHLLLRIDENYPDVVDDARVLVDHWFTRQSPLLAARATTALAVALRLMGELDESVARALDAVRHHQEQSPDEWRTHGLAALTALVSALGQSERYDEAVAWVPDLAAGADAVATPIVAGDAYWALANVYVATGEVAEGLAAYDRAIAAVDPGTHLRRWARMHRAAADFRVQAGIDLDGVPGLLDKAQTALSLSSAPSDLVELGLVRGKLDVRLEDWEQAREVLEPVVERAAVLTPSDKAEAHHLYGTALRHLGEDAAAAEHLRLA